LPVQGSYSLARYWSLQGIQQEKSSNVFEKTIMNLRPSSLQPDLIRLIKVYLTPKLSTKKPTFSLSQHRRLVCRRRFRRRQKPFSKLAAKLPVLPSVRPSSTTASLSTASTPSAPVRSQEAGQKTADSWWKSYIKPFLFVPDAAAKYAGMPPKAGLHYGDYRSKLVHFEHKKYILYLKKV